MGKRRFDAREAALSSMLGAAALALPALFHLVGLGSVFLPMYLPLMTLPFLVSPAAAGSVALVAPLLSGLLTGMPPFYPPMAVAMSLELSAMAVLASLAWNRRPRWLSRLGTGPSGVLAVLIPVLLLGRILEFALGWGMGLLLRLPPEFLSVSSTVAAFPGIVLLVVLVPALVGIANRGREAVGGSANAADKASFFDDLACTWNEMVPDEEVVLGLRSVVGRMSLQSRERILDLGCGTGRLTETLLEALGEEGRVEAVDFSPAMIAVARAACADPRAHFHIAEASQVPLPDGCLDRVLCFSAWPHFDDPDAVILEAHRLLTPKGYIHVWHDQGRDAIDAIHRDAGEAVRHDRLEPARTLAGRLTDAGFRVTEAIDDEDAYRVSAVKEAVAGV